MHSLWIYKVSSISLSYIAENPSRTVSYACQIISLPVSYKCFMQPGPNNNNTFPMIILEKQGEDGYITPV